MTSNSRYGALGEPMSDHLGEYGDYEQDEDYLGNIEQDMDFGSPNDDTEELETDHMWSREYV